MLAYFFKDLFTTWNKKKLVRSILDNDTRDKYLSKRINSQQKKYDAKQRKQQNKEHKKYEKLMKHGKKKQALELLLGKKLS